MIGISVAMTVMCAACGSSTGTAPAAEPAAIEEPAAQAEPSAETENATEAESIAETEDATSKEPVAETEASPEAEPSSETEASPEAEPAAEAATAEENTKDAAEEDNKDSENEAETSGDENADESPLDERHVTGSLPAYEYPGPELFYLTLYDYLGTHLMPSNYDDEVSIPCPIIVYEDESNNDDIRVYGDFRIYSYYLDGDIMKTSSGGSFPGCVHLKSTDAGYEVTGMDLVEDGSGYTESARKIFGEHFDEFSKTISDSDATEKTRAQIVANYVAANNLSVTAIQDYGWDPQTLPEENIDSFYSTLD